MEYQIKEFVLAIWFKRFFSPTRSPKVPVERDEQNDWIKATFLEWQRQWHDYFDQDRNLITTGEFDRPAQLPTEIAYDYRLIFGLSRASRKTRKKCFMLFPKGKEMHARFEAFLLSKPVAISEADARARLIEVIALIEKIDTNENVDFSDVKIVNRDTDEGLEELGSTDDITILLERSLLQAHSVDEISKVAALRFLTEPLYAAAGNYYHVHDWVTSIMIGGLTDALHTALYQLWAGGWQVLLGQHGLILAHRSIRNG